MFAKAFFHNQRGGWFLRMVDLAERTILYRERGFCPGDNSL